MNKNDYLIDAIVCLVNGCQAMKNAGNGRQFNDLKYVLGQSVRQYEVNPSQIHITQCAHARWNLLTTACIDNFWYSEVVACDRLQKTTTFWYFKGSSKSGSQNNLQPGSKFRFNDMFHVDHIVPVKLIIDELLALTTVNASTVKDILDKMHLCRMLKKEDRKLGRTAGRSLCWQAVVHNVYNANGIILYY